MKDRQQVEDHLLKEFNCYPVYLSDELADRHYNGFSNSILWPLFHYHPGEMNFDEDNWLAYREANMRFAEVVNGFVGKGDMVWVQDYHCGSPEFASSSRRRRILGADDGGDGYGT